MHYFVRPRAVLYVPDDWSYTERNTIDVHPTEPHATGLLDEHGDEIWSAPDPIGFVRLKEHP